MQQMSYTIDMAFSDIYGSQYLAQVREFLRNEVIPVVSKAENAMLVIEVKNWTMPVCCGFGKANMQNNIDSLINRLYVGIDKEEFKTLSSVYLKDDNKS